MSVQLVTVGVLGIATGALLQYWLQNFSVNHCPGKSTGETVPAVKPRVKELRLLKHSESGSESESEIGSASDSGDESDDIDIDLTALNEVPGEVRMSLIVRQDLKMGKGKAAAQCSHATLALYKKMSNAESVAYNPQMLRRWEWGNGQAKITLQVPTQEDMDMLYAQAMERGVNCHIVHDAGRTQIQAGSATVLGLGPAPKPVLDSITLHLKLY